MLVERLFKVVNEVGIHARPAAALVHIAMKYQSKITLLYGEKSVNLKSLMSVMALGIAHGTQFVLVAEGTDALEVVDALEEALLKDKLVEDIFYK